MSIARTLPAKPGACLDPGLLPGDIYAYRDLLPDKGRETVDRLSRRGLARVRATVWRTSGAALGREMRPPPHGRGRPLM
jgi:hypothetical protein